MGPKALELLAEELAPEYVSEVSLLSGPAQVTDRAKGLGQTILRGGPRTAGVRAEWRSSCRHRARAPCVLFDEESVWELPP